MQILEKMLQSVNNIISGRWSHNFILYFTVFFCFLKRIFLSLGKTLILLFEKGSVPLVAAQQAACLIGGECVCGSADDVPTSPREQ